MFADRAVTFERLVAADNFYVMFLGFTTFLITMQFLHILRYNSTIGLLATTLGQSSKDLAMMGFCMMIVFVAFASAGLARYVPECDIDQI